MVDEKELKVIDQISKGNSTTQRELSQRTRLSLGAVNLIIKRLVKRGLIKTRNLNPKKVEYALTPKGFAEKARKSLSYLVKTIDLVKTVKDEIAKIVLEEYNSGQKKFVILGGSSLADVIELALKGFNYRRVKSLLEISDGDALVLIAEERLSANGRRSINISKRLGEMYWGVNGDEG